MPVKFLDPTELRPWGICLALYGPPGVGKTPISCGIAESKEHGAPALLIDVEGGSRSVTHMKDVQVTEWLDDKGKPDSPRFEDVRDIAKRIIDLPVQELQHKTYIFDNMSEIQSLAVNWAQRKDPRGVQTGPPEIQHFGRAESELLMMVRGLRDTAREKSVNIIFIAWDRPITNDSGSLIKNDVGFTPGFAYKFPGLIDMVGYLTVEDRGKRLLTFEPNRRNAAKFRRAENDVAKSIPTDIRFELGDYPIADLVNTLRGGMPFPSKYADRNKK